MNPEIGTFILLSLFGAGEIGMTEASLIAQVRLHVDKSTTDPQLAAELRKQADKSFAIGMVPPLGPKRWRITAAGAAALQEAGLA